MPVKLHSETMRFPFPWDKTDVATVVIVEQDLRMVCLQDFHDKVLYPGGPMPLHFDTLRARLTKMPDCLQMVTSSVDLPMALSLLKGARVLPARCARAKLIRLDDLKRALLESGQRPEAVRAIISTYHCVVPPARPVPSSDPARQEPAAAPGAAVAVVAAREGVGAKRALEAGEGSEHAFARGWPTRLPAMQFSPSELKTAYCITCIIPDILTRTDIPLAAELAVYEDWCTSAVQLDRADKYSSPVRGITMQGHLDVIKGFVGFMHKVCWR